MFISNGVVTFNATDSTGDIVFSVASNNINKYEFDAYGNKIEGEPSSNPFSYKDYYCDSETGLYYLNARYYDPTTEQFTQEDTVQDDNLQYNFYGYCSSNPVMFNDPTGHKANIGGENAQVVNVCTYLAVRKDRSTNYPEIGKIFNGEKIHVHAKSDDGTWAKVTYYIKNQTQSKTGFVHSRYIKYTSHDDKMICLMPTPAKPLTYQRMIATASGQLSLNIYNPTIDLDGGYAYATVFVYYSVKVQYLAFSDGNKKIEIISATFTVYNQPSMLNSAIAAYPGHVYINGSEAGLYNLVHTNPSRYNATQSMNVTYYFNNANDGASPTIKITGLVNDYNQDFATGNITLNLKL